MAKIPRERVGQMMKAVLEALEEAGGEARLRDLLPVAEEKLDLTDHERAVLTKSGYLRWHAIVHFYSIDLVKSGWLRKQAGKWSLTDAGKAKLKLAPGDFIREAGEGYWAWKAAQPDHPPGAEPAEPDDEKIERQTAYEQAIDQARSEIEDHIKKLGPYDLQNLVAELLMAMGYHVPFVAPVGPDGGVDVVAYRDPLGTTAPRIRVQVKHREQKVTVNEVRELEGVLRREGDIGLIVSRGGFTSEAEREIRTSTKHIEAMDLDRLINLWQEHYDKIREVGKNLLPLVRLHFLAPEQES